ncbi:MAG: GNAT family N-acetyltransferase [Thermoplasmata archaeon]
MPSPDVRGIGRVRRARTPDEVATVRGLFEEYGRSLGVDLSFEGFPEETRSLPGVYAPPRGDLLLATWDDVPAGCVGIRPLSPEIVEMKRLYVRAGFRGRGLGWTLARRAIRRAGELRYRSLRLDTLPSMATAIVLYRSLGFVEIAPYREHPVAGTRFFARDLVRPVAPDDARRGTTK